MPLPDALISLLAHCLSRRCCTAWTRAWPRSARECTASGPVPRTASRSSQFSLPGEPAARVAAYLSAEYGIGIRDGRFCAHPLLARLGASDGAVRASLGLGSQADDVDRLITALGQFGADGPAWTYTADHRPFPDTRPMPAWASPESTGGRPACSAEG